MSEGELFICKTDKTLYVGLQGRDICESIRYDSIHIHIDDATIKFIDVKEIVYYASEKIDDICTKVLKPFSKSIPIPTSMDWIKCIGKFISIEKLFMFVLTSKSKDYSSFMELCGKNLHRISWDTTDEDGNTMIHYTTIMNFYPQVACDIIRYVGESDKYRHLICQENKKGAVPLAYNLNSNLPSLRKESIPKACILTQLINSGASLLRKEKNGTFTWKGGDEIFFGALKSNPEGIIVSLLYFKQDNITYRLCCSIETNPICQLVVTDNFNRLTKPLKLIQILQVLQFPCHQIAKKLFPTYVEYDSKIPGGSTVINYIAHHWSTPILEFVVEKFKTDKIWSVINDAKDTILHSAILGDKSENVKYILEYCPEKFFLQLWNSENLDKLTPLDLMIKRNMLTPLKFVFQQYENLITVNNRSNSTLFHIAVEKKNIELLCFLLKQPLSSSIINEENYQGKSPLMLCFETEFVEGIKILIDSKYCNLDISENHGCNILHLAVFFYRHEYFNEILSITKDKHPDFINEPIFVPSNPSVTSNSITKKYIGLTPLLLSMTLKHFDAARLLIKAGGQVDCVDSDSHNFFYFLMKFCRDSVKLVDFFNIQLEDYNYKSIKIPFCPDLLKKNETLLYLAIELNNTEAFELLLPSSITNMVVYQDRDSLNNVFHLALSLDWGHLFLNRIFEKLIFEDCKEKDVVYNVINKRNKKGQTPLLLSVNKKAVNCVDYLLQLECDITAKYELNTSNILHYAVSREDLHIVKSILLKIKEMKLSSEFIKSRNKDNFTPLHLAFEKKNSNVLELLLNLEINTEQQHLPNMTLLNYAIQCGDLMFELLFKKLKQKAALSSPFLECLPRHPILHAIHHKNLLALQTLLDYEPTFLGYLTEDDLSLLHFSIQFKFDKGAELLIKRGLTLTITAQNNQKSILSKVHKDLLIAEDWVGYKLTIGYVLSNIPELSKTKYQKDFPKCQDTRRTLINIVSCQNTEIIEKYLRNQSMKSKAKQLTNIASQYATSAVFNFLINCKDFAFDFSSKENITTAIHLGIYNPCQETFDLLLQQVVQWDKSFLSYVYTVAKVINYKNEKGLSALELAIVDNKQNSFDLLINYGATIGIPGDGTIFHFFLKCTNPDVYFLDRILTLFSNLEEKEDYINFQDKTGCSPLHLAVKTRNKGAYEKIIGIKACKYDLTTKEGDNILHIAIKNGDPELFKQIIHNLRELEIKIDQTKKLMNRPNNAKLSPIFHALNEGKINLFLNEPDIGVEGIGENGSSLLHYAVTIEDKHGKQTEMMNSIIRKGEQLLNSRDSNKQTPLHYAVVNVKLEALECLLQNSSLDLTCQDHLGNSALHYAAESKTTECLSAIIKHVNTQCPEKLTELLNLQNSLSYTPLYSAIQSRNVNAIEKLLEYNANLSSGTITFCNTNSSHAKVPLRIFKMKVKDESVPIVFVGFELVESSTWILSDLPNLKESYLIQKQNGDTVTEIVSVTEDDLKRFILPCHSFQPLELVINRVQFKRNIKLSHLAASNGSLEIMKFLSQRNGFSYLERDDRGYSIHHFATENENKEVLKYLCDQTKNQHPNEFNKLSGTLLNFTIQKDYFEAFKILLEENFDSDLHYTDNHEDTLLHLIVNNGRSVGYTKALLECSLLNASDYCNNKNVNGDTALHLAITKNQIQNVNGILKHNPDMSIQDSEGNTALHIAIQLSTEDIITAIIQHISELSDKYQLINGSNHAKHKPIHLSTLRGSPDIVELLLENNAELYAVGGDGETIFHLAVQLDQTMRMIVVEKILNFEEKYSKTAENDFIYRKDRHGNTPLHLAVSLEHDDIVTYLVSYQIDLALTNNNGQTLLHSAIETQSNSIFDIIFKVYGEQPIIRCDHGARRLLCLQDEKGRSGIHYSIELQNTHAVKQLLSSSVCIDSRDKQGMTVLHYAAKFHKDLENVSLILSHIQGVGIEQFDELGRTVSILNASDKEGRNPLMLAIESTKLEAINAIMEHNPEFVIFDKQGRSVLHYAANNKQILESIIPQIKTSLETDDYLSLINKLNVTGLSALHLSISFSDRESAEYLVSEGARLVLPKDTDSSVVTVAMNGLSEHKHLRVGVFDNGDQYGHIIGYKINSDEMICSTLPQLNDVKFYKNTDFEDSIQQTVISSVLKSNCPEILESLLELNKINPFDKLEDLTLIELAGQCATLSMMQFLCENYKFPFEERDDSGKTVIHHLIYNPSIPVVEYLLQKVENYEKDKEDLLGKKIIDFTDNLDCSPLKLCTIEEKWDNFIRLIKYGADFAQKDGNGNTILHLMIINSKNDKAASKSLDCLLNAKMQSNLSRKRRTAMLNATNKAGLTALHLAITKCNTTAAIQLINAGVDLTSLHPSDGYTVIHSCVINPETPSNLMLLNALSKAVKSYDATQYMEHKVMYKKDLKGNTSLHLAINSNRSERLLEILLSNGAPFTLGNFRGDTPLHLSAMKDLLSHVKTILFFIQKDARDKGYGLSYRRERCIKEIMRKNNKKEMPILLTKDKDILHCMLNFWDDEVMLPLDPYRSGHLIHFSVFNQQRELFEAIVESQHSSRRYEMLTSRDTDDMSPLHIAAEKNDFEIGKILISNGVDININSARGTPIEVSIKSEKVEFATKLIDEGADIKGYVFLLANDRISEKSVTRILDERLLRITDIYSTANCSVIHYAARQSSIARIKFLLSKNADLCALDRDGRRALHHAISSRRELEVLTAILDEAYRIDIKNPESPNLEALLDCDYSGLTPGMLAAELDYVEFFQMICTEKYKFHLDTFLYTDLHGDNLVHIMVKSTSMRCIRFLLPYLALNYQDGFSIIINGRNVLGRSPITLARGKGQIETVNMIVELCDAEFFECCPDVVHRIADEEDNSTLINILDKMVICDANRAVMSTKIMDSNEEGDYPDFAIFNYFLSPLWHKMYTSRTNRTKYHPLLKFAIDAKIRLYKWWYSLMLLLYLLFYIPMVFALLLASHHCDDSLFYYQSPSDIVRLLLEVYIIVVTLLYMSNETIEVIGKWEYLKNLPSVSRKLAYRNPNTVQYYGLENREGYLFSLVLTVLIELPQKTYYLLYKFDRNYCKHLLRAVYEHITSSYSILELVSVIFLLMLYTSRVILYYIRSPEASQMHWTLAALTFISFTFKFFKYTKIFPTLGIYIETIFKVLKKDVPRFMLIIFLILIGYAGGAHLISRRFNQISLAKTPEGQCSASLWLSSDYDSVYSIITPLLSGVLFLLGGGPSNFELEIYQVHVIFSLFYLVFAFGIIVVLLNIFIAQLSQTYSDVNSDKDIIDYKAELALRYEQHSNIAFILKWFFSKALRRIMVETVSVPIEEWNGYLKFYSERIEKDNNVLFEDLKQNQICMEEEKTKGIAQIKGEIKDLKELIEKGREESKSKREEIMDTQITKLHEIISHLQTDKQATSTTTA